MPAPFSGHKHTQASKEKISESSIRTGQLKREESKRQVIKRAEELGMTISSFDGHKVSIECDTCNNIFSLTYQYFQPSKLSCNTYCRVCNPVARQSQAELDLLSAVRQLNPKERIISGDRNVIYPLELDIYIPNLNLAIEYCGMYWHSDINKHDSAHIEKLNKCRDAGIKLITVFEDEWILNRDIVLSVISAKMDILQNRIHARKCKIRQIDQQSSSLFLKENHLQGKGRSKIKFGAYHNDVLVAVMTFSMNEISRRNRNIWEINRFACAKNTVIPGIANRLFRAFVNHSSPKHVISYADLRWGDGAVYEQLGFVRSKDTVINYWYLMFPNITRMHRYGLRKKPNEPKNKTGRQLRQEQGYVRIYDCGNAKYSWRRDSK